MGPDEQKLRIKQTEQKMYAALAESKNFRFVTVESPLIRVFFLNCPY